MSGEPTLTLIGNVVDDPDLRYTPSGVAVANFRVASTPRTYDKQAGEWVDGEALFLTCVAWRDMAENIAETVTKGMRVVVAGRLRAESYTTKDGDNRTVHKIDVDEVGPSLRYATAKVTKTSKGSKPRASNMPADPWAGQGNDQGNNTGIPF